MAFNANTYRANKNAKLAWSCLAEARALKARIATGDAYDWEETISLPRLVRAALAHMNDSILYRNL